MNRKQTTTKKDLFFIISLMEQMQIRYWIVGGWGVDILCGKQNREHRDIDINFDENCTDELIQKLQSVGYIIDTDLHPLRIELYSKQNGFLDIHPFTVNDDGTAKKSDTNGNWWSFDADFFCTAKFEDKMIPCLSVKGQKIFHSGYELRQKDNFDICLLNGLQEINVLQITNIEEKEKIARNILNDLTGWFENKEACEQYILESKNQYFFVAKENDKDVGFLCLKETGKSSVELAVMGVLKDYHRRGIGRHLFTKAREFSKSKGYEFMQVKTVAMRYYEDYDRTNKFYLSVGFKELEVIPIIWGKENPCQIYIMTL